jgi:hypothetical protein
MPLPAAHKLRVPREVPTDRGLSRQQEPNRVGFHKTANVLNEVALSVDRWIPWAEGRDAPEMLGTNNVRGR